MGRRASKELPWRPDQCWLQQSGGGGQRGSKQENGNSSSGYTGRNYSPGATIHHAPSRSFMAPMGRSIGLAADGWDGTARAVRHRELLKRCAAAARRATAMEPPSLTTGDGLAWTSHARRPATVGKCNSNLMLRHCAVKLRLIWPQSTSQRMSLTSSIAHVLRGGRQWRRVAVMSGMSGRIGFHARQLCLNAAVPTAPRRVLDA